MLFYTFRQELQIGTSKVYRCCPFRLFMVEEGRRVERLVVGGSVRPTVMAYKAEADKLVVQWVVAARWVAVQ
jgi:hypothetical protein